MLANSLTRWESICFDGVVGRGVIRSSGGCPPGVGREAAQRPREDHDLLGPLLQGRMMEYLPPPLAPAMFRRQSKRAAHNRLMNVAVSNVPGPRERGHIGDAPVSEIYSVGVLSAGSALNMTVWSYVDQLDIAVLSDDHTFKDSHEATDAMVHAFGDSAGARARGAHHGRHRDGTRDRRRLAQHRESAFAGKFVERRLHHRPHMNIDLVDVWVGWSVDGLERDAGGGLYRVAHG